MAQNLIDRALAGNIAAIRLFLDRAPQDRDRVAFDLLEMQGISDVVDASAALIAPRAAERARQAGAGRLDQDARKWRRRSASIFTAREAAAPPRRAVVRTGSPDGTGARAFAENTYVDGPHLQAFLAEK